MLSLFLFLSLSVVVVVVVMAMVVLASEAATASESSDDVIPRQQEPASVAMADPWCLRVTSSLDSEAVGHF